MNESINTYARFLQQCLQRAARMSQSEASRIAQNYSTLTKSNRAVLLAGSEIFDACSATNDYNRALDLFNDALTRIDNGAFASVDCINALSPAAQQIYKSLKNHKVKIVDDDKRKWRNLEALDVDVHRDNRFRGNLLQWQEVYNQNGVIERKQIERSALASIQEPSEDSDSHFEIAIRY